MNRVFVRDDDANYFTNPDDLDRVYGNMVAQRIPLNFAAIPNVSACAVVPDSRPPIAEAFIPNDMRGQSGDFFIDQNDGLIEWLNQSAQTNVVLHGWRHTDSQQPAEFDINDRQQIRARIRDGQHVFRRAFGAESRVFVAPYDRYSRSTLHELRQSFDVFSTGWFSRHNFPHSAWTTLAASRLRRHPHCRFGSLQILSHPGCLVSPAVSDRDAHERLQLWLQSGHDLVLVLHHWEICLDGEVDPQLLKRLKDIVATVNSHGTYRFASFEELTDE